MDCAQTTFKLCPRFVAAGGACRRQGATLRVTGGTARGTPLNSPKAPGVRPTTDLARSALFNILARDGIEGARAADLFAGTGSLGIEALSRGAASVAFVEADRRQIAVIRANLQATGFADKAEVVAGRAERSLHRLGRRDLILMDPPYAQPFPADLIARIGEAEILGEGGVLVCGHASRVQADDRCGGLVKRDDRRYGDSSLAFYGFPQEAAR